MSGARGLVEHHKLALAVRKCRQRRGKRRLVAYMLHLGGIDLTPHLQAKLSAAAPSAMYRGRAVAPMSHRRPSPPASVTKSRHAHAGVRFEAVKTVEIRLFGTKTTTLGVAPCAKL